MENNFNLTRLLSEGSTSTLSSESYDYYAEIFDQLPSIKQSRLDTSKAGNELGHLSRGDKIFTQPLRNLTLSLQGKRHVRRNMQTSNIGSWESWSRSHRICTRRVRSKLGAVISELLPWKHTLHVIEGRFGVGVNAYFLFLRYLIYMNVIHSALIWIFILGPTTFSGRSNQSEPLRFGENDSVLDFFLGSGYLDRSPVFYGFYKSGSLKCAGLNTPLLYLSGTLVVLLLSVIMEIRRIAFGYKHTWMLGKRCRMNVSLKIFCGWDFTIQDVNTSAHKRSFLRNDLKLYLEEQRFSQYESRRTTSQWVRLYVLRIALNLLVLCLLGAAFYLIYFATRTSQSIGKNMLYSVVSAILHYLPPITITLVNLILPHIFRKISCFEDYSFTVQVNITLMRSIFLKLASLGMFLYFIFTARQEQCPENQFGREMYRLCIFNFLATFCNAFFLNYPRKLVQERFPSSFLDRLSGKQHFLVPFNVLDLVYAQTVSWVGIYFCPVLPLIGTITLILTFYIKKFTVLRCCIAEQRMFRGSNSTVLFHFMLLLGLFMAITSLSVTQLQHPTPVHNNEVFQHSTCGPFANSTSVFNVAALCVEKLPRLAQTIIRALTSEVFVLSLILAEIIVLTSCVSRGRANKKTIERLKEMLVMNTSDKRFLVKKHVIMRRHKKIQSPQPRRMPSQPT